MMHLAAPRKRRGGSGGRLPLRGALRRRHCASARALSRGALRRERRRGRRPRRPRASLSTRPKQPSPRLASRATTVGGSSKSAISYKRYLVDLPLGDRQLARHDRRDASVAVLEDLEEVVALCLFEGAEAPVVEDEDVEARFAKSKNLPANSSFYDRAQAETAVSKTLVTNEAEVAEWMKAGGAKPLELEYHPNGPSFPVGVHMLRGAAPVPVAGVRVVLLKDATMSCGFRILTGFPIP